MQKLLLKTKFIMALGFIVSLVFMPFAALAISPELIPPVESLPSWVGIVIVVLYGVAHAVALLPQSVNEKIPNIFKSLLNFVAANYGAAKNERK